MKYLYPIMIAITLLTNQILAQQAGSQQTEEKQVIATARGFFDSINIKNQASGKYNQVVTEDFFIFELGKKYTIDGLINLFKSGDREWISTEWKLSNFRISLDTKSAHASFENHGVFYYKQNGKTFRSDLKWLESAYMVRAGNQWKIKFFQSDRASEKTVETDQP